MSCIEIVKIYLLYKYTFSYAFFEFFLMYLGWYITINIYYIITTYRRKKH